MKMIKVKRDKMVKIKKYQQENFNSLKMHIILCSGQL